MKNVARISKIFMSDYSGYYRKDLVPVLSVSFCRQKPGGGIDHRQITEGEYL